MLKEKEIAKEEARVKYGITAKFSVMPTNGERRFRLNSKNDGTAYIRTETTDESEGWQNAHYHRELSETYIVQKGSVIFVKYQNQDIFSEEYQAGKVFTTEKGVPHNVYMMKNSVIHTVKHGESIPHPKKNGADWWDDCNGCEKLNSLKDEETTEEILKKFQKDEQADQNPNKSKVIVLEKKDPQFSAAYTHFDKLIWQFPTWIIAFLTAGITIIGLLIRENIISITGLNKISQIIGLLFFSFGILGMILTYAMYRFRYHQIIEKRNPAIIFKSPQFYIHIFSNVLVVILFLIGMTLFSNTFEMFKMDVYIYAIVISIILSILWEIILQKSANLKKINKEEIKVS